MRIISNSPLPALFTVFALWACSLNPQPEPPGTTVPAQKGDAGSEIDASFAAGGAAGSAQYDAGTGFTDSAVPDAAVDAPALDSTSDSPLDTWEEASDAPSDSDSCDAELSPG